MLWSWRGLSGLRWAWRNGRGPHLDVSTMLRRGLCRLTSRAPTTARLASCGRWCHGDPYKGRGGGPNTPHKLSSCFPEWLKQSTYALAMCASSCLSTFLPPFGVIKLASVCGLGGVRWDVSMSLLFPDGWCGQACPHVFTEDDSLGSLAYQSVVPCAVLTVAS